MNRAQFMSTYRKLTPNQRTRTAIAIDFKDDNGNLFATPYNWNELLREVLKGTVTSRKLLEALK